MAWSNAWSDVIRANWSALLLFLDHRQGTWDDYSSYARTVTQTATGGVNCGWRQGTSGKGLTCSGGGAAGVSGGRLVVSASADLAGTVGTLMFLGNWGGSGIAGMRMAECRAATTYYDIYQPAATTLSFFDNSGDHTFTPPAPTFEGSRSLCFTFLNGAKPEFYHNGVPFGTAGANSILAGGVVPSLNLYNYNSGTIGNPWWRFLGFLLFSTRLTGAEISQLHNDFMESAHYL